MPNYLTEKDWKTELDKKEHKDVKKTGISEALRDYEKAAKSGNGALVGALDGLIGAAKATQTKFAADKTLHTYLGEMIKAAGVHKGILTKPAAPVDDIDKSLASAVAAAKAADSEKALNFVCAPGNKSSGLAISRKPTGTAEIARVKEQRGTAGGPVLRGIAYGEKGKLVFDFGQSAPPGGIAKALQKALKANSVTTGVIVRGGGKSIDEEDDQDTDFDSPFEQATGMTDYKVEDRVAPVQAFNYVTADEWAARLDAMKKQPPERREATLEAILGFARRDAEALKTDTTLSTDLKKQRGDALRQAVVDAKALAAAPVTPAATAPTANTPQARRQVLAAQRRQEIDGNMARNVVLIEKAAFVKGSAAAMATKPELAANSGFDPVRLAFEACESDRSAQNLRAVRTACDTLDARLQNLRVLQKAGFPVGTADEARTRQDLDQSKDFQACAKIMEACEADPSAKNIGVLRQACGLYLQKLAKARAGAQGAQAALLAENEKVIRNWAGRAYATQNDALIGAQEKASLQARTQARLLEIAAGYKALGPVDQWGRDKEEAAAELQAAYLFEEGTVASGANFGPSALGGGEGGVNAAFWIKRKAPVRAGATEGADRLLIFKPADAEADVALGLKAGSGAAREVFAKDLADYLTAAGLPVAVCPTNLVNIDAHKLGGGGQPRLGAMQRLEAETKGGLDLLASDSTLASRIDKTEFDQLAAFDLIIGNLDRHAGNVLLGGDLATRPKLVPIDHGTSMPDAETLKFNRLRVTGSQNSLLSPELPQADQPMSASAQQALRAINPAEMAQELSGAQARLAARHGLVGQPGMGLSNAQIKLMTRSTQFAQAACGQLTVRELFEAKVKYLDQIMADPEPNWTTLAANVRRDLDASQASLAEVSDLIPGKEQGKLDTNRVMTELEELGWLVGVANATGANWIKENGGLVRKILAGGIVNPKMQDQAAEAYRLLGETAPANAAPLTKNQLYNLQSRVTKVDTGDLKDRAAVQAEFDHLGGDAALGALRVSAMDDNGQLTYNEGELAKMTEPKARGRAELALLRSKVGYLRVWKRFEAAGGIAELKRLNGVQLGSTGDMFVQLLALKSQEAARSQVNGISANQVDTLQDQDIAKRAAETQAVIDSLRGTKTKAAFQQRHGGLTAKRTGGRLNEAQGGLRALATEVSTAAKQEISAVKVHRDEVAAFHAQVDGATPGQVPQPLADELTALEAFTDVQVLDSNDVESRRKALKTQLDAALPKT